MKIPRDLSGGALVKALCRHWEYQVVHQVGSHIILETATPSRHRVVVPDHRVLRIGTLHGILRVVSQHKMVSRDEILKTL